MLECSNSRLSSPKAYVISLGCPKNQVDTESLMTKLAQEGYSFTNNPKQADLILINTCAFIKSAKEESIDNILEMAKYKKQGKCKHLIVAGCLPQRYKYELPKLLPEVDAFIGTPTEFSNFEFSNVQISPPWTAYVKIAEGCNNRCNYCVIPSIRGKLRIRPMLGILKEVKALAKSGVKEIIFVAQDTTVYPQLPKLLKMTAKIKGVSWIRLLYAHPAHVSDALIETMANEKKIVKYLDLPIQHVSDKILTSMNRRYMRQDLENLISKIRRKIPKIALRISLLVGFPGEGKQEFQELLAFIKQVKFSRLGVFTYSKEEGTPAYIMRGQVSEKKKQERLQMIMQAQACIASELNQALIGQTLDILIEGAGQGCFIGRSYLDAPGIDGTVLVSSKNTIKPGEIVKAKIKRATTYDLIGYQT